MLSMQRSLKLLKTEKPKPRFKASVGLKCGTSKAQHRQQAAKSYGSSDTSWSRTENSHKLLKASAFDHPSVTTEQAYEDRHSMQLLSFL